MINNKFLSNTGWIIGGKIFQMSISLFVGMITARYLGPSNFGTLNYTASFIAFFTSLCNLGLNAIIINEFIDNPSSHGKILGTSIGMRICSSIVSGISIIVIIRILNPKDPIFITIASLQVLSLIFQSFDMINYWYQSKLMSKMSTIIQSIGYVVVTIYRIILLISGKSVEWFAFCISLDAFVNAALLLISYYKNGGPKLTFSMKYAKNMIKKSYHFIISGIMVAAYTQMDKIMIGKMMNTEMVGFFSIAASTCAMWTFILMAIIDSSRPIIIDERNNSYKLYERRIRQLYATIIWMSFIVGIIITLFAKWIVLILYGHKFLPAVSTLRIITWSTMFAHLGVARGIWLICEEKQRYIKQISFLGALLNLALNFLLIPRLGINGAALATLVTQMSTNFIIPFFFKEIRQNSIYIVDAFLLKGVVDNMKIKKIIGINKIKN